MSRACICGADLTGRRKDARSCSGRCANATARAKERERQGPLPPNAIARCLASFQARGGTASLRQLEADTGASVSTVHNACRRLLERGLLEQTPSGSYQITEEATR